MKAIPVEEPTAKALSPAGATLRLTDRSAIGDVEPMPTLPAPLMTKRGFVPSAVEEAISKMLPFDVSMPSVQLPFATPSEYSREGLVAEKIERLASGVVVPMPTRPADVMRI